MSVTAQDRSPSLDSVVKTLLDDTIPYPMRMECYRKIDSILTDSEKISDIEIKRLMYVFISDLKKDVKFSDVILKILPEILKRVETYKPKVFLEVPQTAMAIINILTKIAPLHKIVHLQKRCLEVLLLYPDETFIEISTEYRSEIINLISQYLGSKNMETTVNIMILETVKRILQTLTPDKRKEFVSDGLSVWFSKVVPCIFRVPSLRGNALEVAEMLLQDLKDMNYVDNQDWQLLLKDISEDHKYPRTMKEMLSNNDNYWHRAWCCIIRLLGKQLHKSGSPINTLLPVLENAFKTSAPNRCKAFQCWRVLIENFALNKQELLIPKRIKLLSIPFKVHNAKFEDIGLAKFEVWWFLIGLIQSHIEMHSNAILIPFLNFCFGSNKDKPVMMPGQTFPAVQLLTLQAFVEIVGHSDCNGCTTDIQKLDAGILSVKLLKDNMSIWIFSLREFVKLVSKRQDFSLEQKSQFVKCVWGSMLKVSSSLDDKHKEQFKTSLLNVTTELVQECESQEALIYILFNTIICGDDSESNILETANKEMLHLILCPAFFTLYTSQKLLPFINKYVKVDTNIFIEWFIQKVPANKHTSILWDCLAQSLVDNNCVIDEEKGMELLFMPFNKEEYFFDVKNTSMRWLKLYNQVKNNVSSVKFDLDLLKRAPLDSSHLSKNSLFYAYILPEVILSVLEKDSNLINLSKEAKYVEKMLTCIEISKTDIADLAPYFCKYLNKLVEPNNTNIDAEIRVSAVVLACLVLNAIIECMESKDLRMDNYIDIIQAYLNIFKDVLSDKKSLDLLKKTAESKKVLSSALEKVCQISSITLEIPAVIKMLDLVNSKSSNQLDSSILTFTSATKSSELKNLGLSQDTETKTSSPKTTSFTTPKSNKVKTGRKPKSASKIVDKVISGNEEYVVVKTNWKFNPKKLTEHQKEVLKKKRDDIPALYQDLSQSQEEMSIPTWKTPGYKTDSQETSTTASDSNSKSSEAVSKILKDIPNTEVCPKIIKQILPTSNATENTNVESKENKSTRQESMSEKVEVKKETKLLNNVKSPRVSLKDRLTQNLQNLLGSDKKNVDDVCKKIDDVQKSTPIVLEFNTDPETTSSPPNIKSINMLEKCLSAPPKVDKERPSRLKRKPKKFESDFEGLPPKKRCSSLVSLSVCESPIPQESENATQKDTTVKSAENVSPSVEEQIEEMMVDPVVPSEASKLVKENVETKSELHLNGNDKKEVSITALEDSHIIESEIKQKVLKVVLVPSNNIFLKSSPNVTTPLESKQQIQSAEKKSTEKASLGTAILKKTSRLVSQLAIDTVEGHPLLTPKDDKRPTRKSRADSIGATPRKNTVEKLTTKRLTDSKAKDEETPSRKVGRPKKVNIELTPAKSDTEAKSKEDGENEADYCNKEKSSTEINSEAVTKQDITQNKEVSVICIREIEKPNDKILAKTKPKKYHNLSHSDEKITPAKTVIEDSESQTFSISKDETVCNVDLNNDVLGTESKKDTQNDKGSLYKATDKTEGLTYDKQVMTQCKAQNSTPITNCNTSPKVVVEFLESVNVALPTETTSSSSIDLTDTDDIIESSQDSSLSSGSVYGLKSVASKLKADQMCVIFPKGNANDGGDKKSVEKNEEVAEKLDTECILLTSDDQTVSNTVAHSEIIIIDDNELDTQETMISDSQKIAEADTEPMDVSVQQNSCEIENTQEDLVVKSTHKLASFEHVNCSAMEAVHANPENVGHIYNNPLDSEKMLAEADTLPVDSEVIARLVNSQRITESDNETTPEKVDKEKDNEDSNEGVSLTATATSKAKDRDITSVETHNCDIIEIPKASDKLQIEIPANKVSTGDSILNSSMIEYRTPEHSPDKSLCSPFKDDEERNKEFLNNTFDISPIRVASPSKRVPSPPMPSDHSNDYVVIKLTSPVRANGEPIDKNLESPEIFTNEKRSPDGKDYSPPRVTNTGSPSTSLSLKKNKTQVRQTGRAAQMVGLCLPGNSKDNDGKEVMPITPVRRNLKTLYNTVSNDVEEGNGNKSERNDMFLKFSKVLPTSDSSPSSSILKRKLADLADEATLSPASKRKRVSFHDPPVSSTLSIHKYIEGTGIRSPSNSKLRNSLKRIPDKSLVKCLENEYRNDDKETDQISDSEMILNDSEFSSLDDTPSLQVIKHSDLNNSDPIYPDLIHCKEPITSIALALSSHDMQDLLVKELQGKVETVGDLAKLSELEVNRLCLKAPKIHTVRKVLATFAAKKSKKINDSSHKDNMEIDNDCNQQNNSTNDATKYGDKTLQELAKSVYFNETQADENALENTTRSIKTSKQHSIEAQSTELSKSKRVETSETEMQTDITEINLLELVIRQESTENIINVCLNEKTDFTEQVSRCGEIVQKTLPSKSTGECQIQTELDLDAIFDLLNVTSDNKEHADRFRVKLQEILCKISSPGQLVKFCCEVLQKKIPID